jgi:AGCS family alanine or glycine:cation symporter
VQANTFTGAVNDSLDGMGVATGDTTTWIIAVVLAAITAAVVFGGLQRIAHFAQLAVPVMALVYLGLGTAIVVINADELPGAIANIFDSAFGIEQFAGAALGTVIIQGVRRGMFSNEGGMGSAPNAGATATVSHPVKQGLTQAFGVYFDTILICSISAFIILTTDPVYGDANVNLVTRGVDAALGGWALQVMALILVLFTFTSVVGNYFYGETSVRYLRDNRWTVGALRVVVVALVLVGSVASLETVWSIADVTMGLRQPRRRARPHRSHRQGPARLRPPAQGRPRPGVHARVGARARGAAGVGAGDRGCGARSRLVMTMWHRV